MESTIITPSWSWDGPKVIVNFLSAWRLSSLVKGMSNHRLLVSVVRMLLPNIFKNTIIVKLIRIKNRSLHIIIITIDVSQLTSTYRGAFWISWLPKSTLIPVITKITSLFVTSTLKPIDFVETTYIPVVFKRCLICATL